MRNLPKHLAALPERRGGVYVVMTADNAWGRGPTLAEACAQARRAGARNLALGRVIVWWQADAAWQAHRAEHGAESTADRPYIDDAGSLCWWGQRPEQLLSPAQGARR